MKWEDFLYPNGVLKNKLGIKDFDNLLLQESYLTAKITKSLLINPKINFLSWNSYKEIHKELFKDIYDWAGQPRTVEMRKSPDDPYFKSFKDINKNGEKLFQILYREQYFSNSKSKEELSNKIGNFINELNQIHPFREGNGRAQKVLCKYLFFINGYNIKYSNITPKEWNEAFQSGQYPFSNKIAETFLKNIKPISIKIQNFYRSNFGLETKEIGKEQEIIEEDEDLVL